MSSLFPELENEDVIQMATTGKTFEKMIAEHLREKYPNTSVREQVKVGKYMGGYKNYVVDILFNHDILISAKYQETPGTAEQKIFLELGNLQKLCDKDGFTKAYLVYEGKGLTLVETYNSEERSEYLKTPSVEFISYEDFKEMNIA